MKRIARTLLSVVALILIVSMITSCGIINIIANYVVSGMSQTTAVNFNSLEYTRPNFDEIHQTFDTENCGEN